MCFIVLILDGNSEKGEHVKINLCYSTCLMHLLRSEAVTNWIFFSRKTYFLFHARASYSDLSPYKRAMCAALCLYRFRSGPGLSAIYFSFHFGAAKLLL